MEQSEKKSLILEHFVTRSDIYARRYTVEHDEAYNQKAKAKGFKERKPGSWAMAMKYGVRTPIIGSNDLTAHIDQRFATKEDAIHVGMYSADGSGMSKFLVMDFDDKSGLDPDGLAKVVEATIRVTRNHGLNIIIEASKSVQGRHLWLLFEEKVHSGVAAALAKIIKEDTERELGYEYGNLYDMSIPANPYIGKINGIENNWPIQCGLPLSDYVLKTTSGKGTAILEYKDGGLVEVEEGWEYLKKKVMHKNKMTLPIIQRATQLFEENGGSGKLIQTAKNLHVKSNTYWSSLASNSERFEKMKSGCYAIRAALTDSNIFESNKAWTGLLSNIAVFYDVTKEQDQAAEELAHAVSKTYQNAVMGKSYDYQETETAFHNKVNYFRTSHDPNPTGCWTLQEESKFRCPIINECSGRCPALFGASEVFHMCDSNHKHRLDDLIKIEERNGFNIFRSWIVQEAWQYWNNKKKSWDFSKYENLTNIHIGRHLIDECSRIRVPIITKDGKGLKSIYQEFSNENDAKAYAAYLKSNGSKVSCVEADNKFGVWDLRTTLSNRILAEKQVKSIFRNLGINETITISLLNDINIHSIAPLL